MFAREHCEMLAQSGLQLTIKEADEHFVEWQLQHVQEGNSLVTTKNITLGMYRNVEASREVVGEGGETTNVLVLDQSGEMLLILSRWPTAYHIWTLLIWMFMIY